MYKILMLVCVLLPQSRIDFLNCVNSQYILWLPFASVVLDSIKKDVAVATYSFVNYFEVIECINAGSRKQMVL